METSFGQSVDPMRSRENSRCKHMSHIDKLGKRNPPPQKSLHFLSIQSLLDVFEMSSQKLTNHKKNATWQLQCLLKPKKSQTQMQPCICNLERNCLNIRIESFYTIQMRGGSLAHALHNVGQLKETKKRKVAATHTS